MMNSACRQDSRARWLRTRIGILCGLLAFGLGLIVSAGYQLMANDGTAWREEAEKQRQRRLRVVPKRGTIYDRNGSALSVSVEVPSVTLDGVELLRGIPRQEIPGFARESANLLARALGLDAAAVERKILAKRRFSWLKRQISAEEAEAIRRLADHKVLGKWRIRGLAVEGEGRRYFPRRELAGPLLGFVAPDGEGKDGLELSLNGDLRGHVELLRGLRDRSGRLVLAHGIPDDQALAGHDIELTIDQGIQHAAERELSLACRTFEAAGGSVIVVDPRSGEILALASWPGYNPNDYAESDAGERRERGIVDTYEPGSSVKIFTLAAGLAHQVVTPTQRIYCEKGIMPVDNVLIRDTHPAGWLTVSQVLAVSSNICTAKVGLSMGGDKLYTMLRRFGFGQKTGIPLPGEASGTLRPRGRPWVQVETASASFGQGISATNLQMVMATAAIANGGRLMDPVLVKRVTTASGELVREASPRVRRVVVSPAVARTVTEMMVGVTEGEGTGVDAAIAGYTVAAKTATAQKTDAATGRYSLDDYIAALVGFVPAEDPVVAIAVMVDSPRMEHAGGAVAAPIFRRVGEMVLRYRGLTPSGTERVDPAKLAGLPDPAQATTELLRRMDGKKPPVQEVREAGPVGPGEVRVPDLTGWPMRAAVRRAVELGVVPEVQGTGHLARQSPAPGDRLSKGEKLTLIFEPAT